MNAEVPQLAWLNGEIVPFAECVLHARSQGAFWGANVFEGLRGYWRAEEATSAIFRGNDHIARLRRSMRSLHMPARYEDSTIREACLELLSANRMRYDAHLCVVVYFGTGESYDPLAYTDDIGLHITAMPAPRGERFRSGAHLGVSSWRRISDDSMPPRIKTGANYGNSRLAHHEAVRNGFDTALLLNRGGTVAETPGSNIAMISDRTLVTPPCTSGVLEGITLATVADLATDQLGLEVQRRDVDRTELYTADEVFLCGTLAEVQPVVSIDRVSIGSGLPGAVTRRIQEMYDDIVRSRAPDPGWAVPIDVDSPTSNPREESYS